MTWNLGSVSDAAWNLIDDVPSAVSGAVMLKMAEIAVNRVENWTRKSVGLTGIDDKYQGVLTYYTAGLTANRMAAIGADSSFKLGEFSEDKGKGANVLQEQATGFFRIADDELKMIGRKVVFFKALG